MWHMAKTRKLALRLDKRVRDLAETLCEGRGITLSELVRGLILLDAALVTSGPSGRVRLASEEELPRWVLYDFPVAEFRAAMRSMVEERLRAKAQKA
jgi:hypothetical protein